MSNLHPEVKRYFDSIKCPDNILIGYDNYRYNVELFMIPKSDIAEYERMMNDSSIEQSEISTYLNERKVIIADTGGSAYFNILKTESTTFPASCFRTIQSSNGTNMVGVTSTFTFNIMEQLGCSFTNQLEILAVLLGYASRHKLPYFVRIWFSGYENKNFLTSNETVNMKIGDLDIIHRGCISNVKTRLDGNKSMYEVSFATDNAFMFDKEFQKALNGIKFKTSIEGGVDFLDVVLWNLAVQVNTNIGLDLTPFERHKVYAEKLPIYFRLFDPDGNIIVDTKDTQPTIVQRTGYLFMARETPLTESLSSILRNVFIHQTDAEYAMYAENRLEVAEKMSEGKYSDKDKLYVNTIDKLVENIKDQQKIFKGTQNSQYIYGTEFGAFAKPEELKNIHTEFNNFVLNWNSTQMKYFKSDDYKIGETYPDIEISTDNSSLASLLNDIVLKYALIPPVSKYYNVAFVPDIQREYLGDVGGKSYYSTTVDYHMVLVPGFKERSEEALNTERTPEDISQMEFLKVANDTGLIKKKYAFQYNAHNLEVIGYESDLSFLYFMDIGLSSINNIITNVYNKNTSDVLTDTLRQWHTKNDLQNNDNSVFEDAIKNKASRSNGSLYMEDVYRIARTDEKLLETVADLQSNNMLSVARYNKPILDSNLDSNVFFTDRYVGWANIVSSGAFLNVNLSIIGDPFWLSSQRLYSTHKPELLSAFPIILLSYNPFVVQQDDDTFEVDKNFQLDFAFYVMEVTSVMEGGKFTQKLKCALYPPFAQNTSKMTSLNSDNSDGSEYVMPPISSDDTPTPPVKVDNTQSNKQPTSNLGNVDKNNTNKNSTNNANNNTNKNNNPTPPPPPPKPTQKISNQLPQNDKQTMLSNDLPQTTWKETDREWIDVADNNVRQGQFGNANITTKIGYEGQAVQHIDFEESGVHCSVSTTPVLKDGRKVVNYSGYCTDIPRDVMIEINTKYPNEQLENYPKLAEEIAGINASMSIERGTTNAFLAKTQSPDLTPTEEVMIDMSNHFYEIGQEMSDLNLKPID
jgi:hypothetical protein